MFTLPELRGKTAGNEEMDGRYEIGEDQESDAKKGEVGLESSAGNQWWI